MGTDGDASPQLLTRVGPTSLWSPNFLSYDDANWQATVEGLIFRCRITTYRIEPHCFIAMWNYVLILLVALKRGSWTKQGVAVLRPLNNERVLNVHGRQNNRCEPGYICVCVRTLT